MTTAPTHESGDPSAAKPKPKNGRPEPVRCSARSSRTGQACKRYPSQDLARFLAARDGTDLDESDLDALEVEVVEPDLNDEPQPFTPAEPERGSPFDSGPALPPVPSPFGSPEPTSGVMMTMEDAVAAQRRHAISRRAVRR